MIHLTPKQQEWHDGHELRGGFYVGVILALACVALAIVCGGGQV